MNLRFNEPRAPAGSDAAASTPPRSSTRRRVLNSKYCRPSPTGSTIFVTCCDAAEVEYDPLRLWPRKYMRCLTPADFRRILLGSVRCHGNYTISKLQYSHSINLVMKHMEDGQEIAPPTGISHYDEPRGLLTVSDGGRLNYEGMLQNGQVRRKFPSIITDLDTGTPWTDNVHHCPWPCPWA
jgi:hypothetical protein